MIHYAPWVGINYEGSNDLRTRLLILGESHYGEDEPDATIKYTKQYSEGEFSHRFWTTIMQIVTGKHHYEIERQSFWNSVAFYNYIQEPAGDGPRERPTEEMWKKAEVPFGEMLIQLKPKHMLVLGGQLWENLPADGRQGPNIKTEDGERDTWIYSYGNGEVLASWVYHPSSIKGASSSVSHPYVRELLKLNTK